MTVICLQCQTTNTPKTRFCRSCGSPVTLPDAAGDETMDGSENIAIENPSAPMETTRPLESEASPEVPVAYEEAPVLVEEAPATSPGALALEDTLSQPEPPVSLGQAIADEVRSELSGVGPSRVNPSLVAIDEDIPIRLACNFNRLFILECNSTFQIQLENQGPFPLESCVVRLDCGGWEKPIERGIKRLAPGQRQVITLGTLATRPGSSLLNCSCRGASNARQLAYFGTTTLTVMTKPDAKSMVFNIVNNQNHSVSGANAGLGGDVEFGNVQLGDVVNKDMIGNINDLIQIALPEKFEYVELSLDYEVSQRDIEIFEIKDGSALSVPKAFIGFAQEGIVLKLTPVSAPAGSAPLRPILLSSRRLFKFGRIKSECDYLLYFWPRNKENDEKSRRLSQWHCSLEWRDDGLWLVDNHSTNCTTFDKAQVTEENPVQFAQRAEIGLAGSYFIDALPFESAQPKGPVISNIRQWAGPPETERHAPHGCVRFTPTQCEAAYHDAVWLLTDGTFGSNRTNPIVFDVPGLAETRARFHHWRGCYWLENTLDNNAVRINSLALKSHEIVPLVSGQTIELGKTAFRVEVLR